MIHKDPEFQKAIHVMKTGNWLKAFDMFLTLAQKYPKEPEAYCFLAKILNMRGEAYSAIDMANQALTIYPTFVPAYLEKARALQKMMLHADAIACLNEALKIEPKNDLALVNCVYLLEQGKQGHLIDPYVERLKKYHPTSNYTFFAQALLQTRAKQHDEALKNFEKIDFSENTIGSMALYLKAHTLDALKRYDDAMKALEEAKKQQIESAEAPLIKTRNYLTHLKNIKEYTTPDGIDTDPLPPSAQKIAFIIGFPRSATTLTGQILQSHPDMTVTDEAPAISGTIRSLRNAGKEFPSLLFDLLPVEKEAARDLYWTYQQVDTRYEKKELFIDKMPLNMIYTPLIEKLFPETKIIFCLRHPLDCILSGYMQNFELNDAMSCYSQMETAVEMYCLSFDCYEQHKQNLAVPIHTLRYEDLVADFETQVRDLLKFLDMEWHEDVMKFNLKANETARTRTPSHSQITQGIYKSSAYKWKNYSKYLEPYFEKLNPYVVRAGYEPLL